MKKIRFLMMRVYFVAICFAMGILGMQAQSWTASAPAAGEFYLYNVGSQKFLTSGAEWGSHAYLNEHPQFPLTLAASGDGYTISTAAIYADRYLGDNGFMDNDSPATWVFTSVGNDAYTIKNGNNYLVWNGDPDNNTTLATEVDGTYSHWKLVTRAALEANLSNATNENPVDATFFLTNSWFAKGNGIQSDNTGIVPKGWSGDIVTDYWGINRGDGLDNYAVEQFHKTFDNYQTLTVPNGVYTLSAQGFYRNDGNGSSVPYFYANNSQKNLVLISDENPDPTPNSIGTAAEAFLNNFYHVNNINVNVTDGTLRIGVKSDVDNVWCAFDNFSLVYKGPNNISADNYPDLIFTPTGNNTVSVSLNMNKTKEVTDTITRTSLLWYGLFWTTPSVGSERTINGIHYKYIGDLYDTNKIWSDTHYSYARTHTVNYSDVTSVTIPANIIDENGNVCAVTSIADQGFVYGQSYQWRRDICNSGKEKATEQFLTMEARNDYLKHVYFEPGCQITSIGEYAFIACTALEDITIPKSVVTIGEGAFECCVDLYDLQFQTEDDGTSALRTIDQFAFYGCRSFETIDLPEGLTTIGQYVFTYNFKLVNIKLPNTLTTIGAHFLCCASSLQTLVIPASVTTIDGALFHGCESLREVYLLGTAGALQAVSGDGNNTFGYNKYYCKDKVADCTFYTTSDYVDSYAGQSAWALIADNRNNSGYLVDDNGTVIKDNEGDDVKPVGTNQNNGNKLMVLQPIVQHFTYKWVTACFPQGLLNYKSVFGPDGMVAEMVGAEAISDVEYHLHFRLIEDNDIPAGVPFLVCPSKDTDITLIDAFWSNQHKDEMTKPHTSQVYADNGALVQMISYYTPRQLMVGDFYFASSGKVGPNENVGNFWKVTDASKAPNIAACKCYWNINIAGKKHLPTSRLSAKSIQRDDVVSEGDGTVDGINNVDNVKIVVDIYDANGRKIDVPQESLPQGFYIVNGKKVIIK